MTSHISEKKRICSSFCSLHRSRSVTAGSNERRLSSQVAYIHLIPYIPEVQIVHNWSPETTNYLKGGGGRGVRDYAPPVNSSEFLVLCKMLDLLT